MSQVKISDRDDENEIDESQKVGPGLFARQVFAELSKVVTPTKSELTSYFTVVLVFVLIVMGYVALIDTGFARLVDVLFGKA